MLAAALAYSRERREGYLEELRAMLRIPSISTLPEHREDVRAMACWLERALKEIGMTRVELFETPVHPIVYGEWLGAPGKPTLLIYGHYDVQPVDPLDEWASDPFAGEVRDDYLYARGASDMKGQLFTQLKAMEAWAAAGAWPFNIKYLLEGEEEIGSPSLPAFVHAHRDLLACDAVVNCDSTIYDEDIPAITYALRGLAFFEISLQGPGQDLHSGRFGGSVHNPIHVLAALIAALHDAEGRVALPGFYDQVRPLDEEDRALLRQIPYSDAQWLEMTGAKALYGEAGYTTLERVGCRPTLDLNGIWGGFTGEGSKTVLPARASAKLSTRLVADQDPAGVEAALRSFLEAHVPEGISWTLTAHAWGPGATMDRTSSHMQAAVRALEESFGRKPLFLREGGSVPVVGLLQEELGVDSIMLGFGLLSDGIHGPNEKQYVPNIYRGIETHLRFLNAYV